MGSEVVTVMREAKSAAWEAWWTHVTRMRGTERYAETERRLWSAYQDCADALSRELGLRLVLHGTGAFA